MAGPARTGAGAVARRRKPSVVRDAQPASRRADAAAPSADPDEAALAKVDAVLGESRSSVLLYAAICVLVAGLFVFLVVSTPRVPSRAVRAVVIDAGSTGTRAQLFTFVREPTLKLVHTQMHSVPAPLAALGVAAHGSDADAAADVVFRPLLENLRKAVPSMKQRATIPVLLRATAGLRMLGGVPADLALERARAALSKSGFLFQDEWADILDERDEGIHAWTTVNYLLGRLNSSTGSESPVQGNSGQAESFVGVMELGGSSMQVVFRPEADPRSTVDLSDAQDVATETKPAALEAVQARFLNHTFRVLTKSHLGHGLFDFTKKLYSLFDRESVLESGNPCYRKGKHFPRKTLRIGIPGGAEERRVVTIAGDGDFGRCVASCETVLFADDVPSTSVIKAARNTEFYAFAYFYDRTVGLGLPENPTKAQLIALGNSLCGPASDDSDATSVAGTDEACAEFSYIYAVLKRISGDFDPTTGVSFRFVQYIDGHMLGWSLGTILDQLPSVAKGQFEVLSP